MVAPMLAWPEQSPIVYCSTLDEVDRVCAWLAALADGRKQRLIVGFDMEWQYRPEEKPPALIQLCVRLGPGTPPLLLPPHPPTAAPGELEAADAQEDGPGSSKRARRSQDAAGAAQPQPQEPAPQGTSAAEGSSEAEGHPGVVCYLLHLARLGSTAKERAPDSLRALLEHPKVFLVTAGDRDEEKLQQDLGINPSHLEQINMMHFLLRDEEAAAGGPQQHQGHQQQQGKLRGKKRKQAHQASIEQHGQSGGDGSTAAPGASGRQRAEIISLASLVGLYLNKRLDKAMQLANEAWEGEALDAKARWYAATDAYAHLLVFEEIRQRLKACASKGS